MENIISDKDKTYLKSDLKPGLYILPSPLGNLDDLSLRQINILSKSNLIAAEDTRRTLKLLSHLNISHPLISYREQNHVQVWPKIKAILESMGIVSLVSDAGTPVIADPGAELIKEARLSGFSVFPLPGPSSVTTALSASGFKAESFTFAGFLPPKEGKRREFISSFKEFLHPLIFFETPHRLEDSLYDLLLVLGPRVTLMAREMTKVHEEYLLLPLDLLLKNVSQNPRKGEVTLVIEGKKKGDNQILFVTSDNNDTNETYIKNSKEEHIAAKATLLQSKEEILKDNRHLKVISKEWEEKTGFSKKTLYSIFSAWRQES